MTPGADHDLAVANSRTLFEAAARAGIERIVQNIPVFAIGGSGDYPVRGIHVEHLARLSVALGSRKGTVTVDAVGPQRGGGARTRPVPTVRQRTRSPLPLVDEPEELRRPDMTTVTRKWAKGRRWSTSQAVVASTYVMTVAVIATTGFVGESTPVILLATLLSLPASLIALPGYYLAYGLLALVPGANPSESSGSAWCTDAGDCTVSTTGDLAGWFQVTTHALGVLALTCAALLNVLGLYVVTGRARAPRPTAEPAETWRTTP